VTASSPNAAHPASAAAALHELAIAAGNARLVETLAETLAEHPDIAIRELIARNIATPTGTLIALATLGPENDYTVRLAVAKNPAAPEAALTLLIADIAAIVRRAAASNPNMPRELLRQLATTPDPWIRKGVATRHDLDEDIKTLLALASPSTVH
jgi:hypothetical protein